MAKKIGKRFGLIFFKCFIFFLIVASEGRAGSITAVLDKTQGSLDDEFILTVTLSGSYENEPTTPVIKGLDIQRGSTSSRMSMTFGNVNRELEIQYRITAQEPGVYTIPSFEIVIDRQKEQTPPLKLTVQNSNSSTKAPGKDVFLERTLSSERGYVGQQLILTTTIYSRYPIVGLKTQPQSITGTRRYADDERSASYQKNIGGQNYFVLEFFEVIVPYKRGNFSIPVSSFELNLQGNMRAVPPPTGNSLFDDFFGRMPLGGQPVRKLLRSDSLTFQVEQLPADRPGEKPSGLVGEYDLRVELVPQQIKVGETATLEVYLSGVGTLDGFGQWPTQFDASFKVYPDKPKVNYKLERGQGIISDGVIKYALVPTKEGTFDVGPMRIRVFAPKLGGYADLVAEVPKLSVLPNPQIPSAPSSPNSPKQAIPSIGVATPEPGSNAENQNDSGRTSSIPVNPTQPLSTTLSAGPSTALIWAVILLIIATASSLALFFLRKRKQKSETQKKAEQQREKAWQELCMAFEQTPSESHESLSSKYRMLQSWVAAVFERRASALTSQDMAELFLKRNIDAQDVDHFFKYCQSLEGMMYRNGGMPTVKDGKWEHEMLLVLKRIQNQLKS